MNNTLNNINKTNSIKYDGQTDEKNDHSHARKTGKNEYDIKDSKFNVNCPKKTLYTCLIIQPSYPRSSSLATNLRNNQNASKYQKHDQMIEYCHQYQYPRALLLATNIYSHQYASKSEREYQISHVNYSPKKAIDQI